MPKGNSFLTGLPCTYSVTETGCRLFDDQALGRYAVTELARQKLSEDAALKHRVLCAVAVNRHRTGAEGFVICDRPAPTSPVGDWPQKTIEELQALYPLTVAEMLDESLMNLSVMVNHPAEEVEVRSDYPWLVYSRDADQARYILYLLAEEGYIRTKNSIFRDGIELLPLVFKMKGWERVARLQKRNPASREQAFVAMWFAPEMEPLFVDGIKPAVEDDGTKCVRIDRKEHNNKICDEIIAEIRRSRYVVADFTGHRGGVYYEAGFAQGLGIPVISTVRQDHLNDLHFDTRQYSHIVYSCAAELKERLVARIAATIPPRAIVAPGNHH